MIRKIGESKHCLKYIDLITYNTNKNHNYTEATGWVVVEMVGGRGMTEVSRYLSEAHGTGGRDERGCRYMLRLMMAVTGETNFQNSKISISKSSYQNEIKRFYKQFLKTP